MIGRLLGRLGLAAPDGGVPGSLTGSFDINGDVINGWVDKLPYGMTAGSRVEVMRNGSLIASCETGPEARGQLPFTLPIEGRFSGAEIVKDTVKLTVRSHRGDTGTLNLDGATQLELIRTHLGAPVETVLDLDFSRKGNARPYLGKGWAAAGEKSTWTIDENSLIHLSSPDAAGRYLLRLRYHAFVAPLVPLQRLDIYVNDDPVAALSANTVKPEYHEIALDGAPFALAANTTFRLHHPLAARPIDHLEIPDQRRLAFAFRRLILVRPLKSEA